MNLIVRANLCMSYADTKNWLTPSGSVFLIEVYATMMRTVLDRAYRLDLEESAVFKYAFAYYYSYLINNKLDKNGAPVLVQRCSHLFKTMTDSMDAMADKMNETLNGEEPSIPLIIEFIKENGPPRVKNLSKEMLYRVLAVSSNNSVATWLSIDYPPYLVYLLLLSLSGAKHPILSNVINNMFSPNYIKQNVNELLKYSKMYNGVK